MRMSERLQARQLAADVRERFPESGAVRDVVQPAARAGGMGQRDHDRAGRVIALADRVRQRLDAEQLAECKPADRDDQVWAEQLELPVAPEPAKLLLARRRRAVAAARGGAAGIAARHRRAVEALVELVALESKPAPQRRARAAAPGQALLALDDSRCLAEQVRALSAARRPHRPGLEREAGLDAGTADRRVALERGERAVRALADAHARTTTNQRPSWRISPPSSSAASPSPVKYRL